MAAVHKREWRIRTSVQRGFTLIELLLVMVILVVLAGVIVPKFVGRGEDARKAAAKLDTRNLKMALDAFEVDNGHYPSTQEGLAALVTNPSSLPNWKGPYVEKIPNDPWGHPYIYRNPGTGDKALDLLSSGPDGQEGTADDIGN